MPAYFSAFFRQQTKYPLLTQVRELKFELAGRAQLPTGIAAMGSKAVIRIRLRKGRLQPHAEKHGIGEPLRIRAAPDQFRIAASGSASTGPSKAMNNVHRCFPKQVALWPKPAGP